VNDWRGEFITVARVDGETADVIGCAWIPLQDDSFDPLEDVYEFSKKFPFCGVHGLKHELTMQTRDYLPQKYSIDNIFI